MNLNARSLLLIVAVILFVLAALDVSLGVDLISLGLAAFAGAFLVGDMPLGRRM